jgi:hypothetical protein
VHERTECFACASIPLMLLHARVYNIHVCVCVCVCAFLCLLCVHVRVCVHKTWRMFSGGVHVSDAARASCDQTTQVPVRSRLPLSLLLNSKRLLLMRTPYRARASLKRRDAL